MAETKTELQDNFWGEKIIKYAREHYVGKYSYGLGASGDGSVLDCGLFTQLCFREAAGIELGSRCADAQMIHLRDNGGMIFFNQSAVVAGDLVFYKNTYNCSTEENCGVTHVGICVSPEVQIDCGSSCGVAERSYPFEDRFFGRLQGCPIKLVAGVKQIAGRPSALGGRSSDGGFRVKHVGDETVRITKLPEGKCFAEPIYPDYITVSDTVPKWVLDKVVDEQNQQIAAAGGEQIPNGDAPEKAPNGMNYFENDIKYLMENSEMTRKQAIGVLSKEEKYTRKLTKNDNGTFAVSR